MWLEVKNIRTTVTRCTDEEREWLTDYLSYGTVRYIRKFGRTTSERVVVRLMQHDRFPSGFVPMVRKAAADEGFTTELMDKRSPPCAPDPSADLTWLRDYQLDAVQTVGRRGRGILWYPTGAGKTEIAVGLTRLLPCRWLFLVHRTNLGDQAAERYERRTPGLFAGRIGEGTWDVPADATFICATFQTLARALSADGIHHREAKELLASVDGLIVDECFPAGTMVGPTPIERVRVGDLVPSYDEGSGAFVQRRVLRTFVRKPTEMVRLHLSDGRSVVCTGGHPFLSDAGWLPSRSLWGKYVLCTYDHESCGEGLRVVRANDAAQWTPRLGAGTLPAHVLLGTMPTLLEGTALARRGKSERENALGSHAWGQPNERPHREGSNDERTARAGRLVSTGTGGQRAWSDSPGAFAFGGTWLAHEHCDSNEAKVTISDELQAGRGRADAEDCHRGRWAEPLQHEETRHEEGPISSWARVDRVEVLEQGSDGTFGGLCEDGLVYNLQVEGTETFIANGLVAHNCHTLPADSFYNVAMSCPAYFRVGLSGTPLARGDRKSMQALGALGPIIARVRAETLIEAGVLARPRVRLATVMQATTCPTWQGVYGEAIVRSAVRNAAIVDLVRRSTKPALVFVKEVSHGKNLVKRLGRASIRAEFVYGNHSVDYRKSLVRRLVGGHFDALVCSVIFQEGIDIPELRSVVVASGGKSVIATLQRLGRGMRIEKDAKGNVVKDEFEVFDVADKGNKWLEKHTKERLNAYLSEGFETIVEPPSVASQVAAT